MRPSAPYLWWMSAAVMLLLCVVHSAHAQLNEHCTVSVLNRNVQVNPDGSWVLPNVPANFGQVRARATCVQDGVTTSGESALFTVPADGVVNLPEIGLGTATPIPVSLGITPASVSFTTAGQTTQLAVTATYPDRSLKDVTAASTGTTYTTSNPALVTVSADGLITAVASGTAVIQATNDGALGLVRIQVVLAGVDTDGDGIPDDWELAHGLNPNNPADAFEDPDRDGLTNLQEYLLGTDPHNPDTDGDGLSDGQEVALGTHPLLADTDGDGIPDGVEVQTGSNPLDPASFNLARALQSIEVTPAAFVLTVNTISGEASRQLKVTGHLTDGKTTLDLTSTARRTNYTSSDLTVCNFGVPDGRVFAGRDGTCSITITNSGFAAQAIGTVTTFAPTPLSFVSIPGFANNVAVSGNFAYVAAGLAGLQVVDVTDRRAPRIVASLDTSGNANDVQVVGNRAYVADGPAGLQIIDITDPTHPQLLGTLDTPGNASDVAVAGNRVFIADGPSGLQIIDASNPTAPQLLASVATSGPAKGVAVAGNLAAVATGSTGIQTIDVTDPLHPTVLGSQSTGGDARDVVLSGDFAFVADFSQSFTSVDLSDPRHPVVRAATPPSTGGLLQNVALAGRFAFGADVLFVNGVPIIDVSTPATPVPVAILDFRTFRDDNGTGIAADTNFVYLTAEQGLGTENGTVGDTRLYIGQYLSIEDTAGMPPTVSLTAPAPSALVIEGQTITLRAEATDDIAVAAVSFLVNGQVVFTDTAAPFEYMFTVPVGVTSLTISAQAIDFGSNVGIAREVIVAVMPDPGTTVVGRIVDPSGNPVQGATVTCLEVTGRTDAAGAFSIPDVPTIQSEITCTVTFVAPSGGTLTETVAGILPVPGGTTQVGEIQLHAEIRVLVVSNYGADTVAADFGAQMDLLQVQTGLPKVIFSFHDAFTTPTLEFVQHFDAVLLFENGTFANASNIGDLLSQYYVAGGKGIVLGTFYWQNRSDNPFYSTRGWGRLEEVDPFLGTAGGSEYNSDTLNPASLVPHFLTAGVQTLFGTSYRGGMAMRPGTTNLAFWTTPNRSGAPDPVLGYRQEFGSRIVGISIFPDYASFGRFQVDFGGDFYRLFYNALVWAAFHDRP